MEYDNLMSNDAYRKKAFMFSVLYWDTLKDQLEEKRKVFNRKMGHLASVTAQTKKYMEMIECLVN